MTGEPQVINGGVAVDDRGSLRFVNDFNFENVKRFYQVENHRQGFIRAWHGHLKEGKYVYVAKGSSLVCAVPIVSETGADAYRNHQPGETQPIDKVKKFVLSSQSPKVLWIPPGYANGLMNLTEDTVILFFSTSTIEESKGDDIRYPYNYWNVWDIEYR